MEQEHLLLQRVEFDGEALDLSWVTQVTYIETLDLSGSKLILSMNDRESILRDDLGVSELDTLKVTLADPYRRDEMDITAEFVIQTMPVGNDDTITFNCLVKAIHDLKKPAKQPRFFVQEPCRQIISQFMPGVPLQVGHFPVVEDYHLLPAMRPSRLLRQMAREMGGALFYRRNELIFNTVQALYSQPHSYEYHFNDARQENQIVSYTLNNAVSLVDDRVKRNYQGWNITQGHIKGSAWRSDAAELTGLTSLLSLNGLSKLPVPVLDFYCLGNGGLRAGDALSLVWNRLNLEAPVDESLPEKVVIGTVAHRYTAQKYQCLIKAVQPLEAIN